MAAKGISVTRLPRYLTFLLAVFLLGLGCHRSSSSAANGPYEALPGTPALEAKLRKEFDRKRKERGSAYRPRTRHLLSDGWAKYTNRLFLETSPYLLQHAHNPVNWYAWGDEAFETAKKLKRPVLLSVGYSTCHWCHVMEEESFEDEEIARFLNENYIAIKVDREERPDVDAIYMSAVQAMTGGGGWPMTVWLTPERKPFFGGTYFPARDGDRGAGTGFLTLLKTLKNAYGKEPTKITQATAQLTQAISTMLAPQGGTDLPDASVLTKAAREYQARFDSKWGGIQSRMKFPSSLPVRFLLRYFRRTGEKAYLKMATLTLNKMAAGGMYDHVGSGFHRYSTDPEWLVPHFEKMLYDNALLVRAYVEVFQVTGEKNFERVVREVLRYVERDMASPEGAFYSATDADSQNPKGHREEGWFFTWTPKEIDDVLDKKTSKLIQTYYGVTSKGNFEGRNILNTPKDLSAMARDLKLTEVEAKNIIDESREELYLARQKRPPPIRDEKILTAWNALMISAFAQAGLVFKEKTYVDRAVSAARFLLSHLKDKNRLYRSYKDGKRKHNAYLEDYAFFIAALLDLYEVTHEVEWIREAIVLEHTLETYFEDKGTGGFFMTSNDHEKLLAREKPADDGAVPSGNSVALLNLLRLHEFTTQDEYRKRAEFALKVFSGTLKDHPTALSEMLLALDFYLDKPKEVVLVSPRGKANEADAFVDVLRKEFVPNFVLAAVTEGEEFNKHSAILPMLKGKIAQQGKTTAYVCERGICELPTTDPKKFLSQVKQIQKLSEGKPR